MAHGFGGVRAARLDAIAERFVATGLSVLVFDYRHHGTSAGTPRGLINPGMQRADYRAAVAFARTLDHVEEDRVVLWGTSFSGGHVCTVAAEDKRIAAAVAQNPYVDGPAALQHARRTTGTRATTRLAWAWLRDELAAVTGLAPHRVPLAGPPGSLAVFTAPGAEAGYATILPNRAVDRGAVGWEPSVPARVLVRLLLDSPARQASSIKCPLLVAACQHDRIAPVGPAVRLARAAPHGRLVLYAADHFDVFKGPLFERVVADQVTFILLTLTSGQT